MSLNAMPKREAPRFEMIDRKSPEIAEKLRQAPVYQKRGTVRARPATPGEVIVTVLKDGREETTNTAIEGDMVVTNPDGEEQVVHKDKFESRYNSTADEGVYAAKGYIRAIKNPFGKPIEILAQWGSAQYGDSESMIVDISDEHGNLDGEPYIIDRTSFENTYSPVQATQLQ